MFDASGNGEDTISNFAAGNTGDILDFSAFSLDGALDFTTANDGATVNAASFKVIAVTDEALANWSNAEAVINAALTAPDTVSGNAESIVIIDNGTDSRIYHYTDGVDNINPMNPVGTSNLVILGTLTGVNASTLVANNFDMTPFVS